MKANRKARRESNASSPDGGQMLLLAGFVISATAIVAIGTYTALQTGSTEITQRANRPLLDLFLNTRERAIDFFDLVTTNDTAISVDVNLDHYLYSQYQTARSLSIQLNASLAGTDTDAPEKECLAFSEVTASGDCSTASNANYVSRTEGPLWSDDGRDCYSSLTYDGDNDGIITDANDQVVGAIFWLKVEGADTSLEEYVIIDVPETEVSGNCYPWEASWSDSTPGGENLHDVDGTFEDAYAVGDSATIRQKSAGWSPVSDPFSGTSTPDLRGSDVTDDGKRLWFVGTGGSIGSLKVATGGSHATNNSSALGVSATLNDVAVTGDAGEANIYAADSNGNVHFSFDDGATWDTFDLTGASSVKAIDFHEDKAGFAVDNDGVVWETTDGETWSELPKQPSTNTVFGLDANGDHEVWITGVDEVHEWNGTAWLTETSPFSSGDLHDIEIEHGAGHVVGDNGAIYHYDGGKWTDENPGSIPDNRLRGTTLVDNAIAVGDGGTIGET